MIAEAIREKEVTRDEIIINNQKLIYYVLKKMNLFEQHEDFFDLGMIGLIKGADSYDSTKGNLSTYLYKCISNNILMYLRKKRLTTVSFEEEIADNLTIEDVVTDRYDFTKNVERREDLKKCLEKLSKKEKDIVIKYFGLFNTRKYKQKELANLYNTGQSQIAKSIQNSIKKIRKELMGCNE